MVDLGHRLMPTPRKMRALHEGPLHTPPGSVEPWCPSPCVSDGEDTGALIGTLCLPWALQEGVSSTETR